MQKIINKLRYIKRLNRKNYEEELKYIDFESENIIDVETLKKLLRYSIIDEKITEIIYEIMDIKNSQNQEI